MHFFYARVSEFRKRLPDGSLNAIFLVCMCGISRTYSHIDIDIQIFYTVHCHFLCDYCYYYEVGRVFLVIQNDRKSLYYNFFLLHCHYSTLSVAKSILIVYIHAVKRGPMFLKKSIKFGANNVRL